MLCIRNIQEVNCDHVLESHICNKKTDTELVIQKHTIYNVVKKDDETFHEIRYNLDAIEKEVRNKIIHRNLCRIFKLLNYISNYSLFMSAYILFYVNFKYNFFHS